MNLMPVTSSRVTLDEIVRDCPDQSYFDFVRGTYYYLCRSLVRARWRDFNEDPHLTSEEWNQEYKLVQFWDTKSVPDDVDRLITEWRRLLPDGSHELFDDERARDFIDNHYTGIFVEAYDLCFHPAMKSDYFRLLYLYINGGFYVDADERCLTGIPHIKLSGENTIVVTPIIRQGHETGFIRGIAIRDFLSTTHSAMGPECYFANSPIFSTRKNKIIKLALARSTKLLLQARAEGTSCDIHETTGPTNFTLCIAAHVIHSACTGGSPANLMVIEWNRYSVSEDLVYKQDQRNWRNAVIS